MIQCPHLLNKIFFDPHTTFTHPYHKKKLCFIQSASTISPITTNALYKQQQNDSRMFLNLFMICFAPHTIITHPNKKTKKLPHLVHINHLSLVDYHQKHFT